MCREGAGFVAARGGHFSIKRKAGVVMYQALYRKWRPKTFSEVVGQDHITDTLQRQVAEGHIAHAYLFTGTRGTGKTTCARILAKAVNCFNPIDGAPCCECEACRGIDNGTLLDVTEMDAASNSRVDDVRALLEEAIYTPSVLRKRVYIIDEVHMLSTSAFNALLKTLEEPPEHLMFILATTELHKVPATILSRCQRFSFKRILPRDMEKQLLSIAKAESIDLTADGAEILARMANGALRDALSLLDQCRVVDGTLDSRAVLDVLGLAGSSQTMQMMRCILERNSADALMLFDQLYRSGKDVGALLGELSDLGRDLTVMKAAPDGGAALLSGLYERKTLVELGKDLPMERFLYLTSTLQSCRATLGDSFHPRTDAELCLLRLCDESLCGDASALSARIERLEEMLKNGVAPAKASAAPRATAKAPVAAIEEDERPPLPEEPPMPENSERIFDVPEEPPVRKAAPKEAAENTSASANTSLWSQLIDEYKGHLPVNHRVFLNMAKGVFENDTLTVYCNNDFVKDSLNNESVLQVLREVTGKAVGKHIRVELTVGNAPKGGAKPRAAAPAPKPVPKEIEKPAETPPWEDPAPTTASQDRLDELEKIGSRLEHFKIK